MNTTAINQEAKEYKAIKQAVKQYRANKNMGKCDLLPQGDFFNITLKFSPLPARVNNRNWTQREWTKHHDNHAKAIRAKIEALPANASAEQIEAVIIGCVLASANLTGQVVRNYLGRKRYVVKSQPPQVEAVESFEADQVQHLKKYLDSVNQYGDDFLRAFISEELVTSRAELAGLW